ncbi:MAG: hypothetical protein H7839_13825 [Magnetococcus sp. YQC-5]
MSASLQRVLLITGRYLAENPYRELLIKRLLERRGVEVKLAVPGRGLNKGAMLDEMEHDSVFKEAGAIRIHGEWEFRKSMRNCQMVIFSVWRSYGPLVSLAHAEGRPTLNFCATSGLDHWSNGVERCLIRSPFTRRLLQHEHDTMGMPIPPEDQIRVVGSIQYEYPEDLHPMVFPDRASFCRHYGLDPERPIAVLFPKGIQSFHKKVALWFQDWNKDQVDRYNQWFLDKYGEICVKVKESGYNLLIKMHPMAYAAYNCDTEFEFQYWQQYPWGKVLAVRHTRDMYHYADVGVGITTHSSLDMGYFKKPFIYIDSDIMAPPNLPAFDTIQLGRLTPGPSTHWHTQPMTVNPWFRSWLGAFCRAKDLPDVLANAPTSLAFTEADWKQFVAEYWGMHDNQASERIVEEIMAFGEETLASWSRRLSWRRWHGALLDGVERWRYPDQGRR